MSPLSFADMYYLSTYFHYTLSNPIPIKFRFSMKTTRICKNLPPELTFICQISNQVEDFVKFVWPSQIQICFNNMSFNGAGLQTPNRLVPTLFQNLPLGLQPPAVASVGLNVLIRTKQELKTQVVLSNAVPLYTATRMKWELVNGDSNIQNIHGKL